MDQTSTKDELYWKYFRQLSPVVQYTNDLEYRNCIRTIFSFDPNEKYTYNGTIVEDTELDPITLDELGFDGQKLTTCMDYLYKATENCEELQELYLHAAGLMFSTDLTIGQVVLCSYDHLHLYFPILYQYLVHGKESMISCREYTLLKEKLKIS